MPCRQRTFRLSRGSPRVRLGDSRRGRHRPVETRTLSATTSGPRELPRLAEQLAYPLIDIKAGYRGPQRVAKLRATWLLRDFINTLKGSDAPVRSEERRVGKDGRWSEVQ